MGRAFSVRQRTFAVYGPAQCVDRTANEVVSYRDLSNAARGAHFIALFYLGVVAHDCGAHGVLFQVHGHANDVSGKSQQLRVLHSSKAVNPGYAVAHLGDCAYVHHGQTAAKLFNLTLYYSSQDPGLVWS